MKIKLDLDEKDMEVLSKVSEITDVDYDGRDFGEPITIEILIDALKDMIVQYERKEEELEDHIKHCEEFHKEKDIDYYDYYGVSREDFH